jgi:hypothetical protein
VWKKTAEKENQAFKPFQSKNKMNRKQTITKTHRQPKSRNTIIEG